MCGRMTLYHDESAVVERFSIAEVRESFHQSYNFAPSQQLAVVTLDDGQRVLETMKWGLVPFWAKDEKIGYKMINARAEGIESKPSFRAAIKRRRCLIPADGFYEWRKDGEKTKTPIHIHLPDSGLFAFAGLWEEWQPKGSDDEPLRTCTIITTSPNEIMKPIHDRMPVILESDDEALWLDTSAPMGEALDLLTPFAGKLETYAVSTSVNSPKNHGAALIERAE